MRTLFVDFDGTLSEDKFWRSLDEKDYQLVQEVLFHQAGQMVNAWMRGEYTSEEITDYLSKQTGLNYQKLWLTLVSDCQTMQIKPQILESLIKLKKQFYLVLITGNMDCFDRFTVPSLKLDQYFSKIVNSYNEGHLKTENNGDSFKKYLKGRLTDAILIDNSATTCALFGQLGGQALLVTSEQKTAYHLSSLIQPLD